MVDPGLTKIIQLSRKILLTACSNLQKGWGGKVTGRKEKRSTSEIKRQESVQLHISARSLMEVLLPLGFFRGVVVDLHAFCQ